MANNRMTSETVDAATKRSIARRFNDVLAGRAPVAKLVDQRTARKLSRYRKELQNGRTKGNKPLSALEIARRVHELLESGETLTEIKKLSKPRTYEYDEETMVAVLAEMQPVYNFCADAYRFAGVRNETLLAAGVINELPKKRGPKKKS